MYTCSIHHTSVRKPKLVFFFRVLPTKWFPICGRMPLPALSLWAGRQPCRPRLVDERIGGGPSAVAPRSLNPPTDILITVFARPTPVRSRLRARQQSQSSPAGKDSATSSPILTDDGTSVRLSFQSRSLLLLADESSNCDQN